MNEQTLHSAEHSASANRQHWLLLAIWVVALAALTILLPGCGSAKAGPNGGDLIPNDDGSVNAELLANQETGEVMIHTWDKDLKQPAPIDAEPLKIEVDGKTMELAPHPTASDPAGKCSQFYGRADWVQGGGLQHGNLHGPGFVSGGHMFGWNRCWKAGRSHGQMWSRMQEHGSGHGGHGMKGGHK
mgnify:CR=1 FL=1|tara:strand:- start:11274 stop:11831 length:558 start_codon:yes stop_codon:yes gene_type:complete